MRFSQLVELGLHFSITNMGPQEHAHVGTGIGKEHVVYKAYGCSCTLDV
jgi:hypothetical protein